MARGDDWEERYRRIITSNFRSVVLAVNPASIHHRLHQKEIVNFTDYEEIMHEKTTADKNQVLLHKIYQRGGRGLDVFLETVGVEYPELYRKITGDEPPRRPPSYPAGPNRSSVTNYELALKALTDLLDRAKTPLNDAITALKAENQNVHLLEERIEELEKEREIYRAKQEQTDKILENLRLTPDYWESKVQAEKKEKEKYQEQISEMKEKITQMEKELENANGQSRLHYNRSVKVTAELRAMKEDKHRTCKPDDVDFQRFMIKQLKEEERKNRELTEEKEKMEEELTTLQATINSLKGSVDAMATDKMKLKQLIGEKEQDIKRLQSENQEMCHSVGSEMLTLVKELNTEKNNISHLEKYVEELLDLGDINMEQRERLTAGRAELAQSKATLESINTRLNRTTGKRSTPNGSQAKRNAFQKSYPRSAEGEPMLNTHKDTRQMTK